MHSVGAGLSSATDVSTSIKRDENCETIDNGSDAEPCGETEGLRILDEFRKLYESRIDMVDRESGGEFDRASTKLQIMSDWIKDLGEQNTMLVRTVEDLEQAAYSRVKILEEKLKQSSQLVVDNLTKSSHSEEALNALSNRVSRLQRDEEYLQQRIEYLQSDVRGLLELIRRARCENDWSLEGITFFEIQPKDIPVSADCICRQEQIDFERVRSLNLQIEQHQENEKKMMRSQLELEGKIADLTKELSLKDESINKYVSRLQCFCEKLKAHAKQTNQVINCPLKISSDQDCDIILTPDILESVLIAKDTENKNLRRQLQDVESKLMVYSYENSVDTTNLRIQFEEKCNKVQQLEDKIIQLEKEAVETRDVLTAEIAALEKQNYHANIGNFLKNDLIKEMRKELKHVTLEDTTSRMFHIDSSNPPEVSPVSLTNTQCYSKKDDLVLFLYNTKAHIQRECKILSDLKFELKNFIEKLTVKNDEMSKCIMSDNCVNENELCLGGMSDRLINCIEIITKMYSEREKEITLFDCMINKEENHCSCGNSKNTKSNVNNVQQFKLMEEFRICTVEAQAAIEDIREEISIIVSNFNTRHQNYEKLSKTATNVQNYLIQTRKELTEAIDKLELQEEERLKHNERIINGKSRLKDIKNEINQAQTELSYCINNMKSKTQECSESRCVGINNELLTMATEEVEEILNNLQVFQIQGDCMTSTLKGLKSQFCTIDNSLKNLQKTTDELLSNNEIATTTFCERESRLVKLEEEIDCAHTKMQDVLEILLSMKQEEKEQFSQCICNNQEIDDIIKTKQDLRILKKEYDDLKLNMAQQACQIKCDERLNKWKNHVTELEDQIKTLQHEINCKQEANNFLKDTIQRMEDEMIAVRMKAENYRQLQVKHSIEMEKKIIELENALKLQKTVEDNVIRDSNNETNVKKFMEISNVFRMEYGVEALLHCDFSLKHEYMSQSFKILHDAVQSIKEAIQDLEGVLKKLICEESFQCSVSARSVMILTDMFGKCKEKLDTCFQELSKFKSAVCSKEKLLKNMEEVIRIQQDSLAMSQAEVKDLRQTLQEKIEKQKLVIAQHEKEKNELLKQNELQIQTIGHLQNAIVEAKRNLDQMGHKVISDLCEKDEIIRQLVVCVDETQDQYNECFTEATNQDLLLDLQRDAINSLHKRIRCLEYDKHLITTTLYVIYYSILSVVQKQIHDHVKDFRKLKWKMDNSMQAQNCSESKQESIKTSNCPIERELQNDICLCARHLGDKNCDAGVCNPESKNYSISHMKGCSEADVENITQIKQIKEELEKMKNIEYSLRCENQELKTNLRYHLSESENMLKKLEHIEQKEIERKKFVLKLEDGEREIKNLSAQITDKEEIIKNQSHELEALRKKLLIKDQEIEDDLSGFHASEHEIVGILCDRVHSLKTLLQEKSNYMVKLQVDYELLKNENSILKDQNTATENRAIEEIAHLKEKLKETRTKLYQIKDDYQHVTEDFHKTQEQLLLATKQEADSQESLMIMEKNYCAKIMSVENEVINLRDLVEKLSEELNDTKRKLSSKNMEFSQMQDKCNIYVDQLRNIYRDFEKEKEKLTKIENVNRDLIQQLQKYIDENYYLDQQKNSLEENSSIYITELQDMHKSLIELKKECHLKDQSLTNISIDLTEAAISRSKLCKESRYIIAHIRDCIEQQKKYSRTLAKKLENKQQHLMQLAFEKKALLIKIRKLKRIILLTQRPKRTHRKLSSRNLKKIHISNCVSSSDVVQIDTERGLILSPNDTDSYKESFVGPTRSGRRTSTCGNSWWFPKMEYLINEVRKNNQWWYTNFNNETESNTSLEENRDYGYQSSTSK